MARKVPNLYKSNCCGCGACEQICPNSCIKMLENSEGFLYPSINRNECIGCLKCEKVCPFLNERLEKTPLRDFAVINPDEKIRKTSSSGGVFYAIAVSVLLKKGVVFGVQFDENWMPVHKYINTIADLYKFQGSKYVQSFTGNIYQEVKQFLEKGSLVLFSGTPCQIAGLKAYLRKDYEKLLTIDFICHGVPSPGVWKKYISVFGQNIGNISFRDKSDGWNNFSLRIEDNKSQLLYKQSFQKDPYMQLFLNNYILRPSCYNCKVRSGKSGSDITLADFWNIQKIKPELYDDRGISLVLCNTELGIVTIENCKLLLHEVNHEEAIIHNRSWFESYSMPQNRDLLFKEIYCNNIRSLYIKYLHPELLFKNKLKLTVKSILKNIRYYTKLFWK